MNRERRKQLRKLSAKVDDLKCELESILWDEQDYYDNIPENLQYSARATESEDAIEKMEDAISCFEEAIGAIEDIV